MIVIQYYMFRVLRAAFYQLCEKTLVAICG